jgi:hypothetical protein
MDNMDETNRELYDRINRLIGQNTIVLPAEAIPGDVDKENPIYLSSLHELLEPHEIDIGKSYYAIDIKNEQNVKNGQIENHGGKFYSSGPFQNFGELKKIIHLPKYGYTYYFGYGNTSDEYSPEPIYGSKNPHYYLYLDQDTINKPIVTENVFKISDYAKNIDDTVVASRVAGKKRKTRKSRKSRKPRRKTMRHKKKSIH